MTIDFFDTKQYMDELLRRFNEGGTIWLIERTDTNQFYDSPGGLSIHTFGKGYNKRYCKWRDKIEISISDIVKTDLNSW